MTFHHTEQKVKIKETEWEQKANRTPTECQQKAWQAIFSIFGKILQKAEREQKIFRQTERKTMILRYL